MRRLAQTFRKTIGQNPLPVFFSPVKMLDGGFELFSPSETVDIRKIPSYDR
jgi:hypothetical protein